ncbi:MAG: sugar phosphate nucleotidyltransferase [Planctomycetota bacterium]
MSGGALHAASSADARCESAIQQAIVLCAGEGRRLRPFTERRPKPLFPFLNRPILEHILTGLARAGVRRVACNAWHLASQIEEFAAERRPALPLELHVEREEELLGTGGGLRNLSDWLAPGPVLVVTGDVLADFDFAALAAHHRRLRESRGAQATMALTLRADVHQFGAVHFDPDQGLTDIVGVLGQPAAQVAVNASAHVLEHEFLQRFPAGPCCFVRQGYLPALAAGVVCGAWVHPGAWLELGHAAAILEAQRAALAGDFAVAPELMQAGGVLRPSAGQEPDLISRTARVDERAVLLGGNVIGPDCLVGPDARLSGCLLLPGASVPAGAVHHRQILEERHPA